MALADYKDKKLRESDVASHAEVLAAMDCLVHHLNDEEASEVWLADHLPDGDDWRLLDVPSPGRAYAVAANRKRTYEDMARSMTYGEYEGHVKAFARIVRRQCFETKYTPRAFV